MAHEAGVLAAVVVVPVATRLVPFRTPQDPFTAPPVLDVAATVLGLENAT